MFKTIALTCFFSFIIADMTRCFLFVQLFDLLDNKRLVCEVMIDKLCNTITKNMPPIE